MIIEISVVIAVIIFAVLAFFIIRTLLSLQSSLRRLDHLMKETDTRMRNFDPLLHTIANLGDISKAATGKMKYKYFVPHVQQEDAGDLTEFVVAGIKLAKNFLTRR